MMPGPYGLRDATATAFRLGSTLRFVTSQPRQPWLPTVTTHSPQTGIITSPGTMLIPNVLFYPVYR